MRIAILGGSFNPLHIGHATLAETVIKELDYDKVLFVPTCIPPHKELNGSATTEQRLQMVEDFCQTEGYGAFEMEPCEVKRGGISYTIDTVKFLTEKYKSVLKGKFGLIMGEEIAAEFHKWKSPDEILNYCDLIIVPRNPSINADCNSQHNNPTGDYKGDFKSTFNKETFKYPCTVLDHPILPLSSTEIRTCVKEKRSFKYLVPDAVFKYIWNNGLYR